MAGIENYGTIQNRINGLYNTAWFQPNACYPTALFYTKSEDLKGSLGEISLTDFLKKMVNADAGTNLTGLAQAFTSLDALLKKEQEMKESKENCKSIVLDCFVQIDGLQGLQIPLSKSNGSIRSGKTQTIGDSGSCKLKFLCDRNLEVLRFLQAWQSKWLVFDFEKRSLVSHRDTVHKTDKTGGEGYIGISNLNIQTNGGVQTLSHLSVFGLIPRQISMPNQLGPQASSSGLPTITVDCIYSNAVLSFPVTVNNQKKLRFYYFQ